MESKSGERKDGDVSVSRILICDINSQGMAKVEKPGNDGFKPFRNWWKVTTGRTVKQIVESDCFFTATETVKRARLPGVWGEGGKEE